MNFYAHNLIFIEMDEYINHLSRKLHGRIPARPICIQYYTDFIDACENADFRDYYLSYANFDYIYFSVLLYIIKNSSNETYKCIASLFPGEICITYYPRSNGISIRGGFCKLVEEFYDGEKIMEKESVFVPNIYYVIEE